MQRIVFIMWCSLMMTMMSGITISYAGEMNQTIANAQQREKQMLIKNGTTIQQLATASKVASAAYQSSAQQAVATIPVTHSAQQRARLPQAILFVSLSMPTPLLRDYLREGKRYHIPLVLRGFEQNNLRLTLAHMQRILQPDSGKSIKGGFAIDPMWFRCYHIQRVPTLIVNVDANACQHGQLSPNSQYAVIAGNLSLKAMLSQFANQPNAIGNIAKRLQHEGEEKK